MENGNERPHGPAPSGTQPAPEGRAERGAGDALDTILVVDDIPANVAMLGETLGRDYRVLGATSGPKALELASARRPDLILLDVMMAGMDGYEVCARLRGDPSTSGIPVIFVTALSQEADEARGLAAGAVDYITKPFRPALVRARVRSHLELGRLRERLEAQVRARTSLLEEANRELAAFSYSASHELRAPLRAIDGLTALLASSLGERLHDDERLRLEQVRWSARRMGRLLDDFLDYARAGRAPMRVEAVPMTALVRSVLEELVPLPEARARVAFRLGDLPPARGDAGMLRQVWRGLLSNAVKFSSERERPEVSVEGAAAGDELVYRVRDNGVGFDPRYTAKLFGVFQRLHAAHEFEGTGVGLALARRLVSRHGGRIWGEGAPGEGALFSFALPRVPVAAG